MYPNHHPWMLRSLPVWMSRLATPKSPNSGQCLTNWGLFRRARDLSHEDVWEVTRGIELGLCSLFGRPYRGIPLLIQLLGLQALCLVRGTPSEGCRDIQTAHEPEGPSGLKQFGAGKSVVSPQRTDRRLRGSWELQNHLSQQGERRDHLEFVKQEGKRIEKPDCSYQRQALCKWLYPARLKGRRQMARQTSGLPKHWNSDKEGPQQFKNLLMALEKELTCLNRLTQARDLIQTCFPHTNFAIARFSLMSWTRTTSPFMEWEIMYICKLLIY